MEFHIRGTTQAKLKQGDMFHSKEGQGGGSDQVFMMVELDSNAVFAAKNNSALRLCVRLNGGSVGEVVTFSPTGRYIRLEYDDLLELKEVR